MSPNSLTAQDNGPARPQATDSFHAQFLEAAVPQWLIDASEPRRTAIKRAGTVMPDWYARASSAQRQILDASFKSSVTAQVQLDNTLSSFKDIDAFARPLLLEALKSRHQVDVDVDKTLLCLKRPLVMGIFQAEIGSFEVLKLPLLQAALHNFESQECKYGAFHRSSGFIVETTTPGIYTPVPVNVSVRGFLSLCRDLDIGAKYQAYLKAFFHPADTAAETLLREHFIASQKAALRAAAERALLAGDIQPEDHAMILSVVDGEKHPRVGGNPVWFHDLGLMGERLVGCVAFTIAEKRRSFDATILYVPNDPEHPLKRYSGQQADETFKRLFTTRDAQQAQSAEPTPYQRFFSQFLPYAKRPYYFSQFVQEADDASTDLLWSPWRRIIEVITPAYPFIAIQELPPRHTEMQPDPDPYLGASLLRHEGDGHWAENADLWTYLYEQHRDRVLADARSHAVPTADVNIKARDAKLAALLQVGLLGLNMVSMFVPVLGEVMMVIMAGQLLYETFEGVKEWSEGDKHAAKAHLVDVAENLALIAVMAGAGAGFNRLAAVKPEPVIEDLHPVTLPNGETRLWKSDLSGYEHPVTLSDSTGPNDLGQHAIDGKTYIRQGDKFYEQFFDPSTSQWRLRHPTEPNAYQPVLGHNGRGAWRHTLERPMSWDTLTLLRRMGHVTEGLSDEALLMLAQISGVSDNTLRKMHLDHLPPPPEWLDAMRLFKADASAGQVIEQLSGAARIDDRYLYALTLVTEMPRWPLGRALEVFEAAELSGPSIRYGAAKQPPWVVPRPVIQLSRAQVLNGEMPARILAALDENEITYLLGRDAARLHSARADALRKQLAGFANTRQPAIFASLYDGTEPLDARVSLLQRECPGLSEAAAQDVLDHATAAQLARMDTTGRSPLKMLEEARWHARQGRQTRAFIGLRSANLATADSRRLALHALRQLPGWPSTLRLELREGSTTGALLDSLGETTAPDKRYLVKNGAFFLAFNERGELLNHVSGAGDNFYNSIMYALPDDARAAIGLPQVSDSHELQRKIIEYAHIHRREAAQLLAPPLKGFKPPTRVSATLKGYYASGRGASLHSSVAASVTELYPSPQQADAFLRQQRGRTDRQIFTELGTRRREWEALNATLDQWQAGPTGSQAGQHQWLFSQALREAWRNGPLAEHSAEAARLSLVCETPLPVITTRFPHVRELSVTGSGITDANADAFIALFPNVTRLTLGDLGPSYGQLPARPQPLTSLPEAVSRLSGLTHLRFSTYAPELAESFTHRLSALTSLQTLRIDYSGFDSTTLHALDLSPLSGLRALQVNAPYALRQWPAYVERLEQLERLDLTRTSIDTLPDALYSGHERLWAGLSLDWSKLSRAAFRRAFEYVKNYSGSFGHLVDLEQMVSEYCRAELDFMAVMPNFSDPLPQRFNEVWTTPEARLLAIDQLRVEHDEIFAQFYAPSQQGGLRNPALRWQWATGRSAGVLRALKSSWNGALRQRYGVRADLSTFALPESGLSLGGLASLEKILTLPSLPAGSFPHVSTLRLGLLDVPVEQARGFIRGFSGAEILDVSGNAFTELPFTASELPALTELDLSNNNLLVTPPVQAQFNDLTRIEVLNLGHNPLNTLDVRAMTGLQALNLRSTKLQSWPTGAESLPQLSWLDLRDNDIASLSPQALAHPDALIKANLTGNVFSAEGETALSRALRRIEQAKGLGQGALTRFAEEPVPAQFPPTETGWSLADLLLPVPERGAVIADKAGRLAHLRRLTPSMTPERARLLLRKLREAGRSDVQIDAQISQWQQASEGLIRQLNDWLYIREVRAGRRHITAQNRSFAALRICEVWLEGLTPGVAGEAMELRLQGLQTGDLPSLDAPLAGVTTLNLRGVGISEHGSDGFLNAFADLNTLIISGNDLANLPGAVRRMRELEQLEMQHCNLSSGASVYPLLSHNRLRRLDLGYNILQAFNPPGFGVLETLDLRYNALNDWPAGVLQARYLRRLDLRSNNIAHLPETLFDGNHSRLVAGTDLSGNDDLSLSALQQLRYFSRVNASSHVLGISRGQIDGMIHAQLFGADVSPLAEQPIAGNGGVVEGEDGAVAGHDPHAAVLPAENIFDPANDIAPRALNPWLEGASPQLAEVRRGVWARLAQEPGHERFFQLIRLLRDTRDYRLVQADLTRRVWDVMDAASENTELRELLFQSAESHGTCPDGRTLTFSEMEVRVAVYRALREIPPNRLMLRGRALLRLSRQLFRLERVETLAEAAGQGHDRAEIRLRYRISLTSGWGDGVDLPGQPAYMLYGTPISDQMLAQSRASILEAERTDALLVSMASRDYWNEYLHERYPQETNAIDRAVAEQRHQSLSELEDRQSNGEIDKEHYNLELAELSRTIDALRVQKVVELTRREINDLRSLADESERPGTLSAKPGPSWRS
jgi:Leucine-rich repeat (LRR) protein